MGDPLISTAASASTMNGSPLSLGLHLQVPHRHQDHLHLHQRLQDQSLPHRTENALKNVWTQRWSSALRTSLPRIIGVWFAVTRTGQFRMIAKLRGPSRIVAMLCILTSLQ